MSARPFPVTLLLRLLLCLGLLVNGSSQVFAVAHPDFAGHEQRVAAPSPCHEASAMETMGSHLHTRSGVPADKPDCCRSGTCECACSHGAAPALPLFRVQAHDIAHAAVTSALPTRYASPLLPRLVRPPIV